MPEYKLAYIDTHRSERNTFIGGVLVTDSYGLPLEFRHTDAVAPTRIEQILYGRALDRYLKAETMARCLLDDLENKPDLLIVPDESYFALTRHYPFPLAQVGVARRDPLPSHGETLEVSENEILVQILSMREPVRVRVDKKNAPTLAAIRSILLDAGRTMDVLEPASRVQEALKHMAQEGAGRQR
ncbi:MAG: hypothetical protein AB1742_10080 [bacterium]